VGLRRLAGDAAEEVAQEAFVVALERWDYVSSLDAPDAWLWVVARRLALRRSGRERARVLKESLAAVDSWHGEVPVDVDLADAVNRLPGQQRAAVVLHYLCGLPVSEVAGIVGGSDSAAKVWLHRARGRLGVLVGGYEGRWVGERRWSTDDVATLARQLGVQGHLDTIRDDVPGGACAGC
jgi:RNA polymerase sigma-70 factor (ECF subfamily)